MVGKKDTSNYVKGAQKRKDNKQKILRAVEDFFAERAEKIKNKPEWVWTPKMVYNGLYIITSEHGVIPNMLSGAYTSLFAAEQAIQKYKNSNA